MAKPEGAGRLVQITGHRALVDVYRAPLQRALGERRKPYAVSIDSVGRVGEVLVSITGSSGHLPLLFNTEDLEPAYVSRVVADSVARFGL